MGAELFKLLDCALAPGVRWRHWVCAVFRPGGIGIGMVGAWLMVGACIIRATLLLVGGGGATHYRRGGG